MCIKIKKYFSNIKQLLRILVLVICICISCYQLAGCFKKIRNPPISTHYKFALNESIKYPAVTVCRNPPFKTHLFEKYGFTHNEIQIASTWKQFDFENFTLQQFFEETTYTSDETTVLMGFDGSRDNLEISSSFTLKYGRCYTYKPKYKSVSFGRNYGYTFYLVNNDTLEDYGYPGFHIYIQNQHDTFSEKSQQVNVFNEYTYVEVGDSVSINLKINKYNQLPSGSSKCNSECNYTLSSCIEENLNKLITEEVGCSTPWVPNKNLELCKTPTQTCKIIEHSTEGDFLDQYIGNSNCGLKCNLTTFTPFLQSVRLVPQPLCGFKIYISSNLYTLMEEVIGYDWNSFLSDLGGSLGFLLGLSVLGMIAMIEQVIDTIIKIKNSKKKRINLNNADTDDNKKSDSRDGGNISLFDTDDHFAKKMSNEEKNLDVPPLSKY